MRSRKPRRPHRFGAATGQDSSRVTRAKPWRQTASVVDGLAPPCSPVLGFLIATGQRIREACCRYRLRTTASAGSIWRPALLARGRARQLDLVELLTSLVTELASAGGPRCAVATKVELSVTMARSSFGWRWRRRQDGDGVVVLAMAMVPLWRFDIKVS